MHSFKYFCLKNSQQYKSESLFNFHFSNKSEFLGSYRPILRLYNKKKTGHNKGKTRETVNRPRQGVTESHTHTIQSSNFTVISQKSKTKIFKLWSHFYYTPSIATNFHLGSQSCRGKFQSETVNSRHTGTLLIN